MWSTGRSNKNQYPTYLKFFQLESIKTPFSQKRGVPFTGQTPRLFIFGQLPRLAPCGSDCARGPGVRDVRDLTNWDAPSLSLLGFSNWAVTQWHCGTDHMK